MDDSELRMNLAALQRIDPYIKGIVDSSSQVALYSFGEDGAWKKTGIEGTLFIYERKCPPIYGFLILNRLGPQNCVQPLTDSIEHQIQPPFILYKTKDSEIYGIWFYEEAKCGRIGETLVKYINLAEQQKQQQQGASSNNSTKVDLGSLLSKASDKAAAAKELDNSRNQRGDISLRTTKDSPSSGGEKLLRMLASAGGGGDRAVVTQANGGPDANPAPAAAGPTSSVVEFFAQASQAQPPPPPALMGSPTQVGALPPTGNPIVGPVVGPPGIINLMHGVPPGMALLPQQPGAPPVVVPLLRNPAITGSPGGNPGGVPPGVMVTAASSGFQPMMGHDPAAIVSQPLQHPPSAIHSLLANPGTVSVEALERTQREESRSPPVDLETDLKSKLNIMGKQRKSPAATQQQNKQQNKKRRSPKIRDAEPELLSPKAFTAAAQGHAASNGGGGGVGIDNHTEPLTQGQMVQAMQHLLRTDKTFVAKLHQAYIDSLNNKLN